MSSTRIIKKYPNRRLYDTQVSRYITLGDVRDLVTQGADFKVLDANTNEDITRSILLQIIMEKESGGEPLFSTEALSQMIRFYGDAVQGAFTSYLDKSLSMFIDQQSQMREQWQKFMTANPVDAMADLTRRNLELWQEMQETFLKTAGKPGEPRSPDEEKK